MGLFLWKPNISQSTSHIVGSVLLIFINIKVCRKSRKLYEIIDSDKVNRDQN